MLDEEKALSTSDFCTFQNRFPVNGKKLYLNKKTADVHFSFDANGNKVKRIPAHKSLLAADSDVFEAMFYGEMKETDDILVTDSTDADFMEFLQYIYLKEIKLSAASVVGLLHLGHKYNVKKCVEDCVQYLTQTVDTENVCERLHLAILYDQSELMDVCEYHIKLNTSDVLFPKYDVSDINQLD